MAVKNHFRARFFCVGRYLTFFLMSLSGLISRHTRVLHVRACAVQPRVEAA